MHSNVVKAVEAIFHKYDKDGSGYLDPSEVEGIIAASVKNMKQAMNPKYLEPHMFIKLMDKNGDGKIAKSELIRVFTLIVEKNNKE